MSRFLLEILKGKRTIYHLGNVRLTYADTDGDGSISPSSEIISEKNYYPFGLEQKGYNTDVTGNVNSVADKFKYNGVELEESLGLDVYEYEYRKYSPDIGKFLQIDPRADKYHSQSPYSFTANNPILLTDPRGDTIRVSGSQEFKKQYAKDIAEIRKDDKLSALVDILESSETDINVTEATSVIGYIQNLFSEGSGDDNHVLASGTTREGTDIDVEYSQINGVYIENDDVESNSTEILAHELTHAYDFLGSEDANNDYKEVRKQGSTNQLIDVDRRIESRAVNNANRLRSARGKKLRQTYGGEAILKNIESNVKPIPKRKKG